MWVKSLYECATEDYPNWDEEMYKAASKSKEDHEMLFSLFDQETNEFAKREGARILAKLNDKRVIPFLIQTALSHEDEEARGEAALALIDLNYKPVKEIFVTIAKDKKAANYIAQPLFQHRKRLAKNILYDLASSNEHIKKCLEQLEYWKNRQKRFFRTAFATDVEAFHEGIESGALGGSLFIDHYTLLEKFALKSEREKEALFKLIEQEKNLHGKFLLARTALKIDQQRALPYLLDLVENHFYKDDSIATELMKLNHHKAFEAFEKIPLTDNYLNNIIDGILRVDTPVAHKIVAMLENKKPEWKEIIDKHRTINAHIKGKYGT